MTTHSEEFVNQIILNMSDFEPHKADYKCAPGKEYEAGSCASLAVLIEMAKAYNKDANSKDKITLSKNLPTVNPQKYKLYLVKEIGKRVGSKCTTQKCWGTLEFTKHMEKAARNEFLKYTHRPNSTQGRFDWLSTFNIDDSMAQYERKYKDFKFFGAVPMDFADLNLPINKVNYDDLLKQGISKLGIIFNLDEHYKSGSHWVGMFTDLKNPRILYFDSYGVKPEPRVRKLMRDQARYLQRSHNIKLDDIYIGENSIQHQRENSECGVYSMNFLIRMARGDDFDKLCNDPIPDKKINKCRSIYFDKYTKEKN